MRYSTNYDIGDRKRGQGINEDSSFVEEIPVDVTKSFLYRGQKQYNTYCSVCHGRTGDGQGIIMTGGYGYVPAPSYHEQRLREVTDGYLYSTIANGIRTMPSYAHQVKVEDRWAIVAYIRALQLSQHVRLANLPGGVPQALREQQ
jgi:mono/diheme cytochrome c family protein